MCQRALSRSCACVISFNLDEAPSKLDCLFSLENTIVEKSLTMNPMTEILFRLGEIGGRIRCRVVVNSSSFLVGGKSPSVPACIQLGGETCYCQRGSMLAVDPQRARIAPEGDGRLLKRSADN